MKELKMKLLMVCVLTLLVGAPVALGHWDPGDGHKMHFPQMPDPCGWDVAFWNDFMFVIPYELADDWRCSETGPVEDIHFWVSWKGGSQPGDIGQVIASIYSNDPCGTFGWSEPSELLWQQTFMGLDNVYYGDGWQGWYNPLFGGIFPSDHYGYYQINITDITEPFIQEEDQIYWLSIQLTPSVVGWKTSLDHFEDNAVWRYTFDPCSDPCGWGELLDPGTGGQLDFAFVITGGEEEPPPGIKWQQLPDPCETGYHCHDGIHMADDWLCEGGLVTDLHWWGTNETHDNEWGFDISIFADACSLPDGPAGPLWTVTAPIGPGPGEVRRTDSGLWHPFYTIWYYEYDLLVPFPQVAGETYWLDLTVIDADPCNQSGWHWQGNNDPIILSPPVQWYPPAPADPCDRVDFNLAFEITSGEAPEPNFPNHKMHWPQLPKEGGWNVAFTTWKADDWQCSETGPVSDIHFWISWEMDMVEPIGGFSVTIHSDVPAGADPCVPWSHPGDWLWTREISAGDFTVHDMPDDLQGWFDPWEGWYILNDHVMWQQINIENIPDPFIQDEGEIYWLEIDFWGASGAGWKESGSPHFNDDGVYWDPFFPPFGNWVPLTDPCTGETMDLAFVITGEPPKEPVPNLKWSQPPIEYDPTDPEPRFCGWDVESWTTEPNEWWDIVADDFRCFGSMPIDSIHWWGSHKLWAGDEPPDELGLEPPIIGWRIGFWTNVPADPMGDPCWSRPEMLLWQIEMPAARVHEERVGIDEHPINEGFPETCFQYYVDLEPDEVFWQEEFLADTADDVFWISIAAVYDEYAVVYYPWGWKTRPWSWMDDAVRFDLYESLEPGMVIDPCSNNIVPLEYYGESYDVAFELDTDPNWIKWDQPFTGIRDWPHYEDIQSLAEMWEGFPTYFQVAADDWQCQGPLPVTALAWYGSYLGYFYQPCDPCQLPLPPTARPDFFEISIWTDQPVDPADPCSFSHPDQMVWAYDAWEYDEVLVGYDKRPHDPCFMPIPGPHEPVFRYTARIPEEEWFWQDPNEETVYWLMIVSVFVDRGPEYLWGWTNHQHVYNDDAVIGYPFGPDKQSPPEGFIWEPLKDQTDETADLSFILYTDPYACRTCADFDDNGSIDLNDLRILAVNWLWTAASGGYNIADLNCDGKIDYEDFAIFALQWLGSCP